MADVLIALGGNVGDVRATFQKAIANICGMAQAALLARSSDYTTPPWGELDQARFVLSAEISQSATSGEAEDKLRESQDELAEAIRKDLGPKPHRFELRRQ